MNTKHILLFENYNDKKEIENFLRDKYYGDDSEFSENPDLSKDFWTNTDDFNGKTLLFRDIPNSNIIMYNLVDNEGVPEEKVEEKEYDKFQPMNSWEKTYDFHKEEQFHKFFYSEDYTEQDLKDFSKFLRENKEHYVLLYHGTSCDIPVEDEGLKKTSARTKKSMQSQTGFVYLSVYPSMAKTFGEMGYPNTDICVYQVYIKIKELKADLDQLRNKRQYSGIEVKNDLVSSLVYGHGARVPRNIAPYEIKKYDVK